MSSTLHPQRTGEHALVSAIEQACLRSADCRPRVEPLARQFGLSLRTLHRRLGEAGTSYFEIVDGVRGRVAIEHLEQTDLSVEEIARRLGFSDVSNFRKAFRKWTGQPTSWYRTRTRKARPSNSSNAFSARMTSAPAPSRD
ncbi:AraC family transcriptional regulator [Variovorax sp. J22R133]|uniref:helix-turn-helix domain-containing protein n=1 Tax=Variovorax brevis TaxID=3053503 RepID=UPI002578C2CE|nr:AraC family transcriptional regulator [Variovorax sp. J22R133]MDM0114799.1 AraC family transcriptional regulator [Variovorax sp. J22R133]